MSPADFITTDLLVATGPPVALDGGADETVWASHLPLASVIRKYFTTMSLQIHLDC